MTFRNEDLDDIDRCAALVREKFDGQIPPTSPVKRENPQPRRRMAGQDKPFLKRGVISPSKHNRHLMRQVSALGMEDPVFGTVEEVPQHPSNIFDDMSISDLPPDMRDMISVASDPTAEANGGIDVDMYHVSLGDLNQDALAKFNMMELSLPRNIHTKNSAMLGQTMEELSESDESLDKMAEDRAASLNKSMPCLRTRRSTKPPPCPAPLVPPKPSAHLMERLNASVNSLPSLALEDVMNSIPSPPDSPRKNDKDNQHDEDDDDHLKSKRSVVSSTTKTTKTSASKIDGHLSMAQLAKRLVAPRKPSKNGSDHAKNYASMSNLGCCKNRSNARVPQRRASVSDDNEGGMLKVYLSQSVQEFSKSALPRGDSIYQPTTREEYQEMVAKRDSMSSSLLVARPENLHVPPTQPGVTGDEPLAKSRVMPNLCSIFPGAGVTSKRSRGRRQRVPTTSVSSDSADSMPSRVRDSVSDITPCTAFDTCSLRAVPEQLTTGSGP